MISKSQVNRKNVFNGKMHCFLKVVRTFYKKIREIICTVVMKEC